MVAPRTAARDLTAGSRQVTLPGDPTCGDPVTFRVTPNRGLTCAGANRWHWLPETVTWRDLRPGHARRGDPPHPLRGGSRPVTLPLHWPRRVFAAVGTVTGRSTPYATDCTPSTYAPTKEPGIPCYQGAQRDQ